MFIILFFNKGETVMKKTYEKPEAEEMLVLSEGIMAGSGEEDLPQMLDNEQNDNNTFVYRFFGS